jgi:hypothetical protein
MRKKHVILFCALLSFFHLEANEKKDDSFLAKVEDLFKDLFFKDSKQEETIALFDVMNYLALPVWKSYHKRLGWSTNIMEQVFFGENISGSDSELISYLEKRSKDIALNSNSTELISKATTTHWFVGDLLLLSSNKSLDSYLKKIKALDLKSLSDENFVDTLILKTTEFLRTNKWGKNELMVKNFDIAIKEELENSQNIFVVTNNSKFARLAPSHFRELISLFSLQKFDPLLNINSSLMDYDLDSALSLKGFQDNDYAYGILKQVYQLVSEKKQLLLRVFINIANKEAIEDFAFNIYFFSGLVDIGWNSDVSRLDEGIDEAIATSVILFGQKAFSANQEFENELENILNYVLYH